MVRVIMRRRLWTKLVIYRRKIWRILPGPFFAVMAPAFMWSGIKCHNICMSKACWMLQEKLRMRNRSGRSIRCAAAGNRKAPNSGSVWMRWIRYWTEPSMQIGRKDLHHIKGSRIEKDRQNRRRSGNMDRKMQNRP